MSDAKDFLCRSFNERDEKEVKKLVETFFRDFLHGEYWDWKYKLNPEFDTSLIAVAEKNRKIVGCNHWLLRDLKISPTIKVQAILGADIAVRPEYRGLGIGKSLLLFVRSSATLREKKPVISYMFADPNLTRNLYRPVAGYIPAPSATTSYVKLLNWNALKKRVRILNRQFKVNRGKDGNMPESDLKILFCLSSAPELLLRLSKNGLRICDVDSARPDIIVESDLSTLGLLKKRKGRVYNLLKMLLTRKLKIRGSMIKLLRFYRSLWILEEIFSQKVF